MKFEIVKHVIRSSPVLQVLLAGFGTGAVIGFKDCDVNDEPMVTERLQCAALLGGFWASQTLFVPFKLACKLDSAYHGKSYDILEDYKYTHKVMTGSWRHDRDLKKVN